MVARIDTPGATRIIDVNRRASGCLEANCSLSGRVWTGGLPRRTNDQQLILPHRQAAVKTGRDEHSYLAAASTRSRIRSPDRPPPAPSRSSRAFSEPSAPIVPASRPHATSRQASESAAASGNQPGLCAGIPYANGRPVETQPDARHCHPRPPAPGDGQTRPRSPDAPRDRPGAPGRPPSSKTGRSHRQPIQTVRMNKRHQTHQETQQRFACVRTLHHADFHGGRHTPHGRHILRNPETDSRNISGNAQGSRPDALPKDGQADNPDRPGRTSGKRFDRSRVGQTIATVPNGGGQGTVRPKALCPTRGGCAEKSRDFFAEF